MLGYAMRELGGKVTRLHGFEVMRTRFEACQSLAPAMLEGTGMTMKAELADLATDSWQLPEGTTHVYSFDKVFNDAEASMCELRARQCETVQGIVTCQRAYYEDSPHWCFVAKHHLSFAGSNAGGATFYVYAATRAQEKEERIESEDEDMPELYSDSESDSDNDEEYVPEQKQPKQEPARDPFDGAAVGFHASTLNPALSSILSKAVASGTPRPRPPSHRHQTNWSLAGNAKFMSETLHEWRGIEAASPGHSLLRKLRLTKFLSVVNSRNENQFKPDIKRSTFVGRLDMHNDDVVVRPGRKPLISDEHQLNIADIARRYDQSNMGLDVWRLCQMVLCDGFDLSPTQARNFYHHTLKKVQRNGKPLISLAKPDPTTKKRTAAITEAAQRVYFARVMESRKMIIAMNRSATSLDLDVSDLLSCFLLC
jgi:hypothetical protein